MTEELKSWAAADTTRRKSVFGWSMRRQASKVEKAKYVSVGPPVARGVGARRYLVPGFRCKA